MPDHAHLLVESFSEQANLRKFVNSSQQRSAYAHACAKRERLWQDGYYDRVLRPSEDPKWVARYILENPVRGKLVTTPLDYPFLGSDVWSVEELLASWRCNAEEPACRVSPAGLKPRPTSQAPNELTGAPASSAYEVASCMKTLTRRGFT